MLRATYRLHVRLRFVSIGVRSCRWVDNCRDVVFRSCAVGTWAVRRGSPLSEGDGRLACSMVNFSSTCWIMDVVVGSDVATSWRTQCIPLEQLSVFTEYEGDVVFSMYIVPEGRACCLCVWCMRELGVVSNPFFLACSP